MAGVVKKKEQINVTVYPWIKNDVQNLSDTPEFSSISDIVYQVLSEFFGKYDYLKARESKEREKRISGRDYEGELWNYRGFLQRPYREDQA